MWGGEDNYKSVLRDMGLTENTFDKVLKSMRLTDKLRKYITDADEYVISDEENKIIMMKILICFISPK